MVDRREEAYRAGYENPLMGDIGPLQRLYGTLGAIGAELGGGDMGTPFGQRFGERQKATKAEIKRLQELRAKFPEEFGRGMMQSADVQDPYMFGLGLGTTGAMRPMGTTRFTPAPGEAPVRALEGPGEMRGLPAPAPRMLGAPQAAPVEPYYRNVPPEMGTSARPMNAYNQNMYGMTTGRYGPMGAQYVPEMAVTDFESYGPMGARPAPGPYAPSGFDQNMLAAYRQGRYNRMAGGRPGPMGGDYTLEELGSAVAPYRQGGLVYEPVGGQSVAQGGGPRQIGGPGAAPRLGYERGPIEGEWSEVYGLAGPRGQMQGLAGPQMAVSPTGMRFDPRIAAAAIGGGAGYMAGLPSEDRRRVQLPPIDIGVSQPLQGNLVNPMYGFGPRGGVPSMGYSTGMPGVDAMVNAQPTSRAAAPRGKTQGKAGRKGVEQGPPMPTEGQFEPNFNYLVTSAIDQMLGRGEAERGRQTQQYYATNPWPY